MRVTLKLVAVSCLCAVCFLGRVDTAFGFAEEPLGFLDPSSGEVWEEETSTVHADLVYAMAIAAGFGDKKAAKLAIWDQLVDAEKLGPGESVTYTNCLGSFGPAPDPDEVCPEGKGAGEQIWPMEYDTTCATSRFGPYSPFFHFPHQSTAELEALKEWGWGRSSTLSGYAAYAWGDAHETVINADCRYMRPETINTGITAGSAKAFATYLHSLADAYSHRDCLAELDEMDLYNLWGTHTILPSTAPACYYVPSNPKNTDAHGAEFGPNGLGTDRTDAAALAVWQELVGRSIQRDGKSYPLNLDTVLSSMPGQPTLQEALTAFVHQWQFEPNLGDPSEYAANRRAYAEQIATAAKALRVSAPRPEVNSISPTQAQVKKGKGITLTILGSGFNKKCKAQFNYRDIKTSYISANELRAKIPADLAQAGTSGKITVYNKKGGGCSEKQKIKLL